MVIRSVTSRVVPRRRSRWFLAVSSAAAFMAASCGSGTVSGPAATIGSAAATPEELALGVVVTAPGTGGELTGTTAADGELEQVVAEEPIGPPLPPLSTAEQVLEVVGALHGPTSDVSGRMNRLVAFPEMATPRGADVREVRADVREAVTGDRFVITSEVLLAATGTVDELVVFYDDELAGLGWTPGDRTAVGAGPTKVEQIAYTVTDTVDASGELVLTVLADRGDGAETTDADGERSLVRLRFVQVAEIDEDGSPRRRFEGWIGDLPLPEGGAVTGAAIQTSAVGRQSLHYSLALRYEGVTPDDVATRLRAALPTGDYVIDPQPSMGEALDAWVYLAHPFFDEARVSPHLYGPADSPLGTVVNVDARVEFSAVE